MNAHHPLLWFQQAKYNAQQGRLTPPVWTYQAEKFTVNNIQAYILENRRDPVPEADMLHGNSWHRFAHRMASASCLPTVRRFLITSSASGSNSTTSPRSPSAMICASFELKCRSENTVRTPADETGQLARAR